MAPIVPPGEYPGESPLRGASFDPALMLDDDRLADLLCQGERDEDFKKKAGEREKPPSRIVNVVVEGIALAISEEARRPDITKSLIQCQATKLGLTDFSKWPEYMGLTELYDIQVKKARGRDRDAVNFLETPNPFRFANNKAHKTRISHYHWVAVEVDRAAEVAGLSKHTMLVICLMLGLATLDAWSDFFDEDIEGVKRYLRRRRSALEGEL